MGDFTRRGTVAEIDLNSLRFNLRSARRFIGDNTKCLAVVKADAYGHGAIECSRAFVGEGVDWLGVALFEEAIELRDAGLNSPVLCLGGLSLGQEDEAIARDVTPVIFTLVEAAVLDEAARRAERTAKIHLKIDTGMGRLGVRWDRLQPFLDQLKRFSALSIEAVMSHFASANDDDEFTYVQLDRFLESVKMLQANGYSPAILDIANSPGAIGHPRSRLQMVRLGGVLYGLSRDTLSGTGPKPELKPVMSLRSVIADLKDIPAGETVGYGRTFCAERDTRIALVPIGYHDGYRRGFSNRSSVLINGNFAPVVGRISMDWTIVDVTEISGTRVGDGVTLIGRSGDRSISAEDLAGLADTISYEITCGIGPRVPREYIKG